MDYMETRYEQLDREREMAEAKRTPGVLVWPPLCGVVFLALAASPWFPREAQIPAWAGAACIVVAGFVWAWRGQ